MHTGDPYSCCLVAGGWVTSVSTGRNALHTQRFIQTCTQRNTESHSIRRMRIQLTRSPNFSYKRLNSF